MAKKSFKNSPALQFMSVADEGNGADVRDDTMPVEAKSETAETAAAPVNQVAAKAQKAGIGQGSAPAAIPAAKAKAPAARPVPPRTNGPVELAVPKRSRVPEGFKPNPEYIETRSRRVQLLMQPTLHDRLREKAAAQGVSLNDLVHSALEALVEL